MKRQSKQWIKKELLARLELPENRINANKLIDETFTINSWVHRKMTCENYFLAVEISIYKTTINGAITISHMDVENFHIFKNNGDDSKINMQKSELEKRIKEFINF